MVTDLIMYPARHISVAVDRSPADVYSFAGDPKNLPKWAAGLSGAVIEKVGDSWVCQSSMGPVTVKFVMPNLLGVMDHDVTLPSGEINHNPFRVLRNGTGAEIIFTLYRLPRMSDQEFEQDASLIQKDLETLKKILET